jgi:hypothetical protein
MSSSLTWADFSGFASHRSAIIARNTSNLADEEQPENVEGTAEPHRWEGQSHRLCDVRRSSTDCTCTLVNKARIMVD